jgi:hypothetical protein
MPGAADPRAAVAVGRRRRQSSREARVGNLGRGGGELAYSSRKSLPQDESGALLWDGWVGCRREGIVKTCGRRFV